MQTIIFYEDLDPTRMAVVAFDESRFLWRENVLKQNLETWLKEVFKSGRIEKAAAFFAVLPETAVGRCMIQVPAQGRPRERRAMAENALMIVLNERAALLRTVPYEKGQTGQEEWAVSGVKKSVYQSWQGYFGSLSRRIRWLSAVDCMLAFSEVPLEDGMHSIEAPLWSAVFAIKNNLVVYGAAAEGRVLTTLQMRVFEETQELGISSSCTPIDRENGAAFNQGRLAACTFNKTRYAYAGRARTDRTFLALLLGCVVLPGLLWIGLQMRPMPVETNQEEGTTIPAVVIKSQYSTLMEGAYQAKSERITILSQEASANALAVHGRCSEVLDLADYMRNLHEADTSLHPLLLDLAKKSEKDRYYYEFVVEISLEGRETP